MSELGALADTVRSARKRKHWGQKELAAAAEVSLGVVNNLERGKTRPQPGNLRAILRALEIEEPKAQAGGEEDDDFTPDFPPKIRAALDIMGMYLLSIPEDELEAETKSISRDIFNRARARGHG